MSLIGEALREADRERVAQTVRRTKPLAQIIIPGPRPRSRRRSRIATSIGIGLLTGVSVIVGTLLSLRMHSTVVTRRPASIPAAPILHLSSPPVAPATQTQTPASVAPTTPAKSASTVAAPKQTPVVAAKPPVDPSAKGRGAKPVAPLTMPGIAIVQQGVPRATLPVPARPSAAPPTSSARVADSIFKMAYAAHTRGDLDAAAELYEKTIATNSAPSNAYNDYGVLLKQRGDPEAAAKMFRQAISHDDTNVDAWINLGDILGGAGEHSDALSAFARAGQLDPSRIAVKTRLAAQYQAIGDMVTARQFFEDAVKLDPNEPAAHYALGLFLQSQRELPAAIREYERFVALAGDGYPPNTVAEVKQHVVALRKLVP